MKQFFIRAGPFVLLLMLLTACGTTPTSISDVEVEMTRMSAQVQACATLQSLGTPYPCNPPTATPLPTSTSTPQPTPTEVPFTGWMHYPEGGEAEKMPYGWVPACEGAVGCPGNSYRYFVNGVPQDGPDDYTGTPGYWPWLLFGGLGVAAFLIIVGIGVYGAFAPQRAMAYTVKVMGDAQAKLLSMTSQPALPAQAGSVNAKQLATSLQLYAVKGQDEAAFVKAMWENFRGIKLHDGIPLDTVAAWLRAYDHAHRTRFHQKFPEFAQTVNIRKP